MTEPTEQTPLVITEQDVFSQPIQPELITALYSHQIPYVIYTRMAYDVTSPLNEEQLRAREERWFQEQESKSSHALWTRKWRLKEYIEITGLTVAIITGFTTLLLSLFVTHEFLALLFLIPVCAFAMSAAEEIAGMVYRDV